MSCPFAALGACACAVSWPTWRQFTGVRAVCGACVLLVVVSLFLPPPKFLFCFFSLYFFCFVVPIFLLKKWKRGARTLQAQAWATSAAVVLCPLVCVVGALVAAAPQGCGSRVLMYRGTGQGGFRLLPLCYWCLLVRRLCALSMRVVATLLPWRAWLGVKG